MPNYAKIDPRPDGSLAFFSSYHDGLVADFKARIPTSERAWDKVNKCWLVTAHCLPILEELTQRHLGIMPTQLRPVYATAPAAQTALLKLEYLGAPKEREDGSLTAFGYYNGGWNAIFSQDVLMAWFEHGDTPRGDTPHPATLYGLLAIGRDVDQAAIKTAYRTMAKRWHPDVNRDPDATEMFKKVNHAYDVLSNSLMRAKYDAGLALEASLKPKSKPKKLELSAIDYYWRPPLRCGFVLVEGVTQLGRFVVSKIIQWEDVIDAQGRIMVTSWPAGANTFEVTWA